jgi:hypothetical protein
MRRMIFVRPPMNKNPNVEMSQRISRIIAIVRKIPGSNLIRKRITTR